jgi:glutamate-1-semialdehyde 2,1-aminomutase
VISFELFERAKRVMPGGVSSPVRSFRSVGGTPPFLARGAGAYVWDEDGRRYLDLVNSWGPLILGHAHPEVVAAVQRQAAEGATFGAPTRVELEMAELVTAAFPAMDLVRFVNSGTEAVMSALRLARAATGRNLVVKFAGCYHGHVDGLLVRAGSGVLELANPDTPGVPVHVARDTAVLPYNDDEAVRAFFAERGDEVAAVIVEPVAGNMGVVGPRPGFLEALRDLTRRHGAVLIFDEVITGFRVGWGGAQVAFGIEPDLTCLGKVIGGGLPVGAYGGRAELMRQVSPSGPVYQAGTLSGNPLAMAAGLATLKALAREGAGAYRRLEALAVRLAEGLMAAAAAAEVPVTVNRAFSLLTVFFQPGPVTCLAEAERSDLAAFRAYFHAMLDRGVYLPPAQFECIFVSLAMDEADVDGAVRQAYDAMRESRMARGEKGDG